MADTSVTERRIRPIQDAIAAGNWKQALKDCEKWQKKGESSDRFLALKAAVLMHQPDAKQREKGQVDTLQLCRRQQPVLNLEAIYQLQDSLRQLSLEAEEGPKLWERAIAARPTDKDLLTTWLNSSITGSNWKSAQKATTALRKAFPKERQYEFWNILMCYLIHQDESLPDKERNLFGTLANRMISKAAQSAPSDKAVCNSEDLSLLAEILMKTGSPTELVQLLQSESLSSVVALDKPHADTLLMSAVEATKDDTGISKKFIETVLSGQNGSSISDDDRMWALLVRTADDTESRKRIIEQIERVLEKAPKHRQVLLAKIDLLAFMTQQDASLASSLLAACESYYDLFVNKAFCFDDLISRLRTAGVTHVESFQNLLSRETATEPSHRLFSLKMEYYLLREKDFEVERTLRFTTEALRLYSETKTHTVTYPEAALLTALGLLCVAARTEDRNIVLQASMILHTASSSFKEYYPLRVLLMQVQMISGQIHMAMDTFFQLSIKNLQWETLGHLLLTRISTLHPCQYGHGEESLNPLGALDLALTVSDNSQRSLDRAIREGLKYESYSNVMDTVQLRSNLQRSFVRQLYVIEERKCRRVLDVPVKPGLENVVTNSVDLRDMAFMPTYGAEDGQLTNFLSCGPKPSQGWINMMRLQECLMAFMVAELGSQDTGLIAYTFANLSEARAKVSNDIPTDLTVPERENGLCTMILSGVVLGTSAKVDEMEESVGKIATLVRTPESAKDLRAATINGVEYPDWKYLHQQFVRLEMLRTVASWIAVMSKKLKAEKDKNKQAVTSNLRTQIAALRAMVEEQVKIVRGQTRELKEKLSASGVLGKLVDAVLGRVEGASEELITLGGTIQELQDEAAVEEYCGALRESWEDALDGILTIKIKTS